LHDDPAAVRMQAELLRRMSPERRLRLACDLSRTVDALAEAGIRDAHPDATDREVFLRLAIRKLGYPLAREVYPEVEWIESARR
jgi:hypothetical protein